jgi:hypothetical protein
MEDCSLLTNAANTATLQKLKLLEVSGRFYKVFFVKVLEDF